MSLDTGGRARWLFRNRELETDVGPIVDLGHGLTRFGENLRPNLFCSFSFFFSFSRPRKNRSDLEVSLEFSNSPVG